MHVVSPVHVGDVADDAATTATAATEKVKAGVNGIAALRILLPFLAKPRHGTPHPPAPWRGFSKRVPMPRVSWSFTVASWPQPMHEASSDRTPHWRMLAKSIGGAEPDDVARYGSFASIWACSRHVRYSSHRDRTAAITGCPKSAISAKMQSNKTTA